MSTDEPGMLDAVGPSEATTMVDIPASELDWVPLAIFIVVVVLVVRLVIKPNPYIPFSLPPVMGVVALMACSCLSPAEVWQGGILGDDKLQPITILAIFLSLAYLCASLDMTGVLAFIALKVTQKAGSSGLHLFSYIYLLSSCFTILTSNDIVVLTLTPIIVYCCQATGIDPLPLLFAVFFPANICSVILIIGNPTNIIVGEANNLTFLTYSRWMIMPAIAMNVSCYLIILAMFRDKIRDFKAPVLQPFNVLQDVRGAVFISLVLISTLVSIIVAPSFHISIWKICVSGAGVVFLRNVFAWKWRNEDPEDLSQSSELSSEAHVRTKTKMNVPSDSPANVAHALYRPDRKDPADDHHLLPYADMNSMDYGLDMLMPSDSFVRDPHRKVITPIITPTKRYIRTKRRMLHTAQSFTTDPDLLADSNLLAITPFPLSYSFPQEAAQIKAETKRTIALSAEETQNGSKVPEANEVEPDKHRQPSLQASLQALPWSIVPFVFGMFVLVEGLSVSGWLDEMAELFVKSMDGQNSIVCVFIQAAITIFLSNAINNQPATILLTRVLLTPRFQTLGHMQQHAGMLGVILGSNVAANFTLLGALAGIMYARILNSKGLKLSYLGFAKVGFVTMSITTSIGCLMLGLDLMYDHPAKGDFVSDGGEHHRFL
eukprot:gb/GEZN01001883.1/.p1 GENE.gb/GEZN01001883.1/~~gb/GEZN01001883.1/.p1  ORF type:complete len:659 (+),score=72.96 gb/GEZN01001883.1/:28-2004(+)